MSSHLRPALVLLDLEQTLIGSWSDPVLLPGRIEAIARAISATPDAQMGLMSWAVYDERDMAVFHAQHQQVLEQALGHSFAPRWLLTMDQWGQELARCTGKLLPRDELFDIFGKDEVFLRLARSHPEWEAREVVLWDDAFPSCTLDVPARNTRASIINVIRAAAGFQD